METWINQLDPQPGAGAGWAFLAFQRQLTRRGLGGLSIPKLSESITMVCVDMSIPSMTHFTAEHELPRLSLCLSHLYPFIHATTASENKVTRNPKVNHHFSLVQNAVFGW